MRGDERKRVVGSGSGSTAGEHLAAKGQARRARALESRRSISKLGYGGLGMLAISLMQVGCTEDPDGWVFADAGLDAAVTPQPTGTEAMTEAMTTDAGGESAANTHSESGSMSTQPSNTDEVDASAPDETTVDMSSGDASVGESTATSVGVSTGQASSGASETPSSSALTSAPSSEPSSTNLSEGTPASSETQPSTTSEPIASSTETTSVGSSSPSTDEISTDGGVAIQTPPVTCAESCNPQCFPDCLATLLTACAPSGSCVSYGGLESCWADGAKLVDDSIGFDVSRTMFDANGDACLTGERSFSIQTQTGNHSWYDGQGTLVAVGVWHIVDPTMRVTCVESGTVWDFVPPKTTTGCFDLDPYGWTANSCDFGYCPSGETDAGATGTDAGDASIY